AHIAPSIGGVSMGVALRRQIPGFNNFTIYEKAGDVGGTWRDNMYPGCSSDVGMHFYSLSTDPKPDWDYTHGYQPQIQAYWKNIVHKYRLDSHISFYTLVVSTEWDPEAEIWHILTQDLTTGAQAESTAKILISAHGILEIPRYPDISGLESFKGVKFHTGRYDNSVSLHGKRVAVIGNGASATQMVPVISEDPTVQIVEFCRTPNWFLPPIRSKYSSLMKWVFKYVPFYMKLTRFRMFLGVHTLHICLFSFSQSGKRYIRTTGPEEYHDALIPSYKLGCRRVIFDTDYLAALHRPNLTLNWNGIDSIVEDGIITKTGEKFVFDVLIFSTGYVADDFPFRVQGLDTTVKDYYDASGGPKAYLDTTVPGFPNFYLVSGPNTTTGHTSVIFTEEVQIDYIIKLIKPVLAGQVSAFNVTHEATDAYNEKIHARLGRSVFMDCVSWYRRGRDGKVTSIFPGAGTLFYLWLRRVDWSHYQTSGGDKVQWAATLRREARGRVSRIMVILLAVLFIVLVGVYAPSTKVRT
ncbi:FAD/NAD(P)-binding domain-containing protein, partial [Hymenopellis radicata]